MKRNILILCAVVVTVYANSLGGSFHFDDEHSVTANPHVRSLVEVPRYFVDATCFSVDPAHAMYRPLLLVTYALNYAAGGYDVLGWHLVNVALHAANACLVAWIGVLLGLPGLWAGLLFAVHPLASEPVNYISARSESLCALFVLLTLALHLKGSRWAWLTFAAALLCKEVAIVTLGLLWLVDGYRGVWRACRAMQWKSGTVWVGNAGGRLVVRTSRREQWWRYIPYGLLAAVYLVVLWTVGAVSSAVHEPVRSLGDQLWLQLGALAVYWQLLVMPVGLSIEHLVWTAGMGPTIATLMEVAGALLIVVAALGAGGVWRWSALASALTLLPTWVVPLNCVVAERRWYLVVAFVALALSRWLVRWPRVAIPVLVLLAALTVMRNRDWHDELSLWSAAAPPQPRVQLYLGNAHAARAMAGEDTTMHWSTARRAYSYAWALDPVGDLGRRALHNLGSSQFTRGDLAGAVRTYGLVLDSDPNYIDAWINLGKIAMVTGDTTQALACLQQAQARSRYPLSLHSTTAWR